nr:F-box domain-containing protein [Oryza sativa Japonica Group]
MASGWAQLPDDLLDNVAQRTAGIKDYVRLRAVCKSWRSFLRPRSRPPWLMLPYDPCSESCVRGFLDASDGTVHEIDLPDTRGKRCCGSSHGWLVLERWPAVGCAPRAAGGGVLLPGPSAGGGGVGGAAVHGVRCGGAVGGVRVGQPGPACVPVGGARGCAVVGAVGGRRLVAVGCPRRGRGGGCFLPAGGRLVGSAGVLWVRLRVR